MDQEKETKRQAERCRALAQRIVRELTPASIQVLGGSGALAEALEKAGAQLLPENAEQGTAALLVVEDPEWVDLPALQCAQVLLHWQRSRTACGIPDRNGWPPPVPSTPAGRRWR